MSIFVWSDDFSVKVEEIDNQHKQLVSTINSLYDAVREERGSEVLSDILNILIDYTVSHFSTEERYFRLFKYEDMDSHVKEHKDFVDKITKFKEGFDKGENEVDLELLNFLGDWLIGHILGTDKKYVELFSEKGLK